MLIFKFYRTRHYLSAETSMSLIIVVYWVIIISPSTPQNTSCFNLELDTTLLLLNDHLRLALVEKIIMADCIASSLQPRMMSEAEKRVILKF